VRFADTGTRYLDQPCPNPPVLNTAKRRIGATRQPRRHARFGLFSPTLARERTSPPRAGRGRLDAPLLEKEVLQNPCARECRATRSGLFWLPEPERELVWFGAGCPERGGSGDRRCKNLHRCVHGMCSWLTSSTAVSVRVAVGSTARREARRCAQHVEALPSEPDRRATRHSLGGQAVWLADPDGYISGA
jgi:hypothetical protein